MIIWLASYPRSGNSYVAMLLKHYFNIPVYSVYAYSTKSRSYLDIIGFHDKHVSLGHMKESDEYFFVKTHELPSDDYPSLYVVRDGRDVLVSYAYYIRNFLEQHKEYTVFETMHDLIINPGYFHGWSSHIQAWVNSRSPVSMIKYEQLLSAADPSKTIRDASSKLGINIPDPIRTDSHPNFTQLHEIQPDFFQNGTPGKWRREMPQELQKLFYKEHGDILYKMGYV